jgi:hypothetical protein
MVMGMTQNPDANPLTDPAENLPGVETASGEDVGYPNAAEQEYHEAAGTRKKGEDKPRAEKGGKAGQAKAKAGEAKDKAADKAGEVKARAEQAQDQRKS